MNRFVVFSLMFFESSDAEVLSLFLFSSLLLFLFLLIFLFFFIFFFFGGGGGGGAQVVAFCDFWIDFGQDVGES